MGSMRVRRRSLRPNRRYTGGITINGLLVTIAYVSYFDTLCLWTILKDLSPVLLFSSVPRPRSPERAIQLHRCG